MDYIHHTIYPVVCKLLRVWEYGRTTKQNLVGTLRAGKKFENIVDDIKRTYRTNYCWERLEVMFRARRVWRELPSDSVPSFLDKWKNAPSLIPENVYSIFTYELLHSLHLSIEELLKTVLLAISSLQVCPLKGSEALENVSRLKNLKKLRSTDYYVACIN